MQATLPKSFTDAQAAYLELFTAAGKAVLDSATQLTPLGIETVRGTLNEAATLATTLPAAKTPQDVVTLNSNFVDALRDSATAYTRSVYEIAAETQSTLTRLVEGHVAKVQETVQEAISQATAGAPTGAVNVADFFKLVRASHQGAAPGRRNRRQPLGAEPGRRAQGQAGGLIPYQGSTAPPRDASASRFFS